jgi:hypothetical protein
MGKKSAKVCGLIWMVVKDTSIIRFRYKRETGKKMLNSYMPESFYLHRIPFVFTRLINLR